MTPMEGQTVLREEVPKVMDVLIACEESQEVCKEFRRKGHRAFSCDIQEESGGHPEWHIQGDVLPLLDGNCVFKTRDGTEHRIAKPWDLIIAHPPCTYLTVSGNRWFDERKYGEAAKERKKERKKAVEFFMEFTKVNCKRVAIENPIGTINHIYRPPTQIIQPWMFGHPERKSTCLWLKNLQPLVPTNVVEPDLITGNDEKTYSKWHWESYSISDPEERRKLRSKTYHGIAEAMADQWG